MDYDGRSRITNRIISGISIIKDLQIKDPTPSDLSLAEFIYLDSYEKLIDMGVLTEEELKDVLSSKKIWSDVEEGKLTELQENLKKLKRSLEHYKYQSIKKQEVLSYIDVTNNHIKELSKRKSYLYQYTAEYLAKSEKYKYLIWKNSMRITGGSPWEGVEYKDVDNKTLEVLMHKAFFPDDLNETVIRDLARSEPWRSIWISSCKVGNLFKFPMTDMTDFQRLLITWSLIYDNVFESMDCPEQHIIDNDVLLDDWFEAQAAKRKAERTKNATSDGKNQEVCIMVDTPEDAKNVYKLNNPFTMGVLKNREEMIKRDGLVKEANLPDVKNNILLQINRMGTENMKNRGRS